MITVCADWHPSSVVDLAGRCGCFTITPNLGNLKPLLTKIRRDGNGRNSGGFDYVNLITAGNHLDEQF